MKRHLFALLAALALPWLLMVQALAVTTQCEVYHGSNVALQDYTRNAAPITSYLVPVGGETMRVQTGRGIDGVLVEYYDSAHNIQKGRTRHIPLDLPLFGGFYAGSDGYYLLTGQENPGESSSVEVFRVTKYDTSWNRLGSDGIYGGNTTIPFRAGSARMDESGPYLAIRTCHQMYTSSDGLNHQANVTIVFNTRTMRITNSFTEVANVSVGYVSHSFNQFIHVENGQIIALDHGDAYPRSLVLTRCGEDISNLNAEDKWGTQYEAVDVLPFPGAIGENTTGASVGGMEITGSSYLIAGNSVVQDATNLSRSTRNVFVAAVDKYSGGVSMHWLTNFSEGEASASTPHLVPLSSNSWLVLWSRNGSVWYQTVDSWGQTTSRLYSMEGSLSDCVPILSGGNITWYTWDDNVITFYDIPAGNLGGGSQTVIENGHRYEYLGTIGNIASLRCTMCGEETNVGTITAFSAWWNTRGASSSYSSTIPQANEGGTMYFWFQGTGAPRDLECPDGWEVELSTEGFADLSKTDESQNGFFGSLTFRVPGRHQITVYPKYNPGIAKTYDIAVICKVHGGPTGAEMERKYAIEPSCTAEGYTGDLYCAVCGTLAERGEVIPKLDHTPALENAREPSCTEEGYTGDQVCTVCGTVVERGTAIPKLAHEPVLEGAKEPSCSEEGYTGDQVCTVCGAVVEQGTAIPKLEHETVLEGAKEPTCTEEGYTGDQVCTVCGETVVQGETIPKTEHQYEDGRCTVCGAAAPTEDAPAVSEPPPSETAADSPESSEPASQETPGTETAPAADTQPPEDTAEPKASPEAAPSSTPTPAQPPAASDGTGFQWPVLVPVLAAVIVALCAVVVAISRRKK